MELIIRALREAETDLLKAFLYEAIFIPAGVAPPDRSILARPELALYYEGFGESRADQALVAEVDGRVMNIPGWRSHLSGV